MWKENVRETLNVNLWPLHLKYTYCIYLQNKGVKKSCLYKYPSNKISGGKLNQETKENSQDETVCKRFLSGDSLVSFNLITKD